MQVLVDRNFGALYTRINSTYWIRKERNLIKTIANEEGYLVIKF